MSGYEIVDCRLHHIRQVSKNLRPCDLAEATAPGSKPMRLLFLLWRYSPVRRAAIIDGKPAAVWGCMGQLLAHSAQPWLFTSPAIESKPFSFFREARREIRKMLDTHTVLETGVLAEYESSLRLWSMMGFTVATEYQCGGRTFLKLRLERS